MILPYELAKELKDLGWPQPPGSLEDREENRGDWISEGEYGPPYAYSPSLEELIAACPAKIGPRNFSLYYSGIENDPEYGSGLRWFAGYQGSEIGMIAQGMRPFKAGATPQEAVARLWIVLNRK